MFNTFGASCWSTQALKRAQGYLKLPNGRALTGQSHDYKRHGTTTLFAASEVATGQVIAAHSKRRPWRRDCLLPQHFPMTASMVPLRTKNGLAIFAQYIICVRM
jgi:hypothetical protein